MKKIYFVFLTLLLFGIGIANTYAQVERFVRQTTIAPPTIETAGFGNIVSGVDLDNDGKVEIYAVNSNYTDAGPGELIPRIYKFEFDGTKWDTVWRATLNIPKQNTYPALTVGDLDKDGKKEVIWGPVNFLETGNLNPPRVVVFEVKGDGSDILGVPDGTNFKPNAQWNMGVADNTNLRPIRWFINDIDNDTTPELIFVSRVSGHRFGVISVNNIPDNGDGSEIWTMEYSALGVTGVSTSTLYDLAILGSTVYLFHANGDVTPFTYSSGAWSKGTSQVGLVTGGPWKSACVVDLNNDNTKEIVIGGGFTAGDPKVVLLLQETAPGVLTATQIADFSTLIGAAGRLVGSDYGDIDRDGKLDFVFGTFNATNVGSIVRMKYLGGSITSPSSYETSLIDKGIASDGRFGVINIANVDGDAKLEVIYTNEWDGTGLRVPLVILDHIKYYTLAQARVDANNDGIPDLKVTGDTMTVTGVITSPNYVGTATSYYIQDHTAGMNLYKSGTVMPFDLGDSVLVTGTLDHYRGLTEIVPFTANNQNIRVLKKNAFVPAPEVVTVANFNNNGETYEGKLIRINGLSKRAGSPAWPATGSNANMLMSSTGTDTVIMRIDADTDIDGQTEVSYPVSVIGVATQFTPSASVYFGGYQIQPRYYATDFVAYLAPVVTFKVNMKVKILEGAFNPAEDLLYVRGSFNGWGTTNQLSDGDGDSIYTVTIANIGTAGTVLQFKFMYVDVSASQDRWESDPNREYTLVDGAQIVDGGYFDRDDKVSKNVSMYFSVNMELERLSGRFNPAVDTVSVNGSFQGWTPKANRLIPNPLNPDIYEGTFTILGAEGENIEFKFWYTPNNWESVENRIYTFTAADISSGMATYSGSFNNGTLATVLNQPATLLFTVYVPPTAVSVINGQPFPAMNTIHVAGSASPLQWPGGGWPNTDVSKMIRLYDDGTHGDVTPGDRKFSGIINFPPYTVLTVKYKYGANFGDAANNGGGNDNEGGFGADHTLKMHRYLSSAVVVDTFAVLPDSSHLKDVVLVGVETEFEIPKEYSLYQNYPNPFNPNTTIRFGLPKESAVSLMIYNVLGELVATLIKNETMNAGEYNYEFNASRLASGTYIYRLTAGEFSQTKKMVLIK